MATDEILDVAIVGGGVSGVYSGWRLLTKGGRTNVTIFEASDRIGGRLLSVPAPGIPNMVAELGGMRILPSVQPRIGALIEELNAEVGLKEQIKTYPFPVDQPENIAYLRGTHLRLFDFGLELEPKPGDPVPKRTPIPYRVGFLERGKTAGQIVINAIEQIVPGVTGNLTEAERSEMCHKAFFDGKPLMEQGFWQVLVRVISGEAYQLALDAGGYQTTLTNWNAADAIPWYLSDFGVNPDYRGFTKGFQQVPLELARLFKKAGGKVELGAQLAGFEQVDGGVQLTFSDGRTVRAKELILAMPRRSLELIAPGSPLLQELRVSQLIRSVTPRPLFKLFTTYAAPWWLPANVKAGRTTTDLPVRQTYYWPTNTGAPAAGGPAMLMASYDDGINIGFWDSFRPKRGVGWRAGAGDIPQPEMFQNADPEKADPQWEANAAPQAMVDEVQRQLALIHGMQFVPRARNAAFRDWGDDPFGGGWNSWNIGVDSRQVKMDILQPTPGAPVYICGEAYSDAQGWVEGALQTADLMLEKLGVTPTVSSGV
jgi:monoamine oxidase